MRLNGRATDQLRPINITRHFTCYAEGSVLIEYGNTKVICNASCEHGVPKFLRGKNQGWITAEYSMLPRATSLRTQRKQNERAIEIQRLIGRSLRAVVDRAALGENTIILDCDVIQADGSTRTAAITGAYVALIDAVNKAKKDGLITAEPITGMIASVSVGIHNETCLLDLDYAEDAIAATDMNIVMNNANQFIEIQGTAEKHPFSLNQLEKMLSLAQKGITQLFVQQRQALGKLSDD